MLNQSLRTAVYCRLSKDDGNVDESQSIQSQKEILVNYVHEQNWQLYDIYIDDGYSGTNFNRPDFQRLINDIELGRIHIVLTKDLSRFGRNYVQTGYYTEEYFPNKGVRFIALNDGFDTANENSNEFAPFKNIINEWYAKDISKKIRFTLDNKAKNGEPRNTVFPIFGYSYNEKYERVPDPETGPIVKMIFEKYIEFGSSCKVAKYLTENKVKLPCYYNAIKYNYNKDYVLSRTEEELTYWRAHTIRSILENVQYTGTYITAKSKSPNFKNKKRDLKNKDCYVFEGRYEPLVDKETYEKVIRMLRSGSASIVPLEVNIFKGVVRCGDCGAPLRYDRRTSKKTGADITRYFCYKKDCEACNTVKMEHLKDLVVSELKTLRYLILKNKDKFIEICKLYDSKGKVLKVDNTDDIEKYIKRNKELDKYIKMLFEQNAKGKIPQSTYDMMLEKYSKEKNAVEEQIMKLTREDNTNNKCMNNTPNAYRLIEQLEELNENDFLKPNIIRTFIHSISVRTEHKFNTHNYNYSFVIRYAVLDPIIKEFLDNEE